MLQKEVEHAPSTKTDAAAAFLASLEEPKLTSLAEAGKKPPIEILPPGMPSLSATMAMKKKPPPAAQNPQPDPAKPMQLEAPPTVTPPRPESAPPQVEASEPATDTGAPPLSSSASDPGPIAQGEGEHVPTTSDADATEQKMAEASNPVSDTQKVEEQEQQEQPAVLEEKKEVTVLEEKKEVTPTSDNHKSVVSGVSTSTPLPDFFI